MILLESRTLFSLSFFGDPTALAHLASQLQRILFFILCVLFSQISGCNASLNTSKPFIPRSTSFPSSIRYVIKYCIRDSLFSHPYHMFIRDKLFAFYYLNNTVLLARSLSYLLVGYMLQVGCPTRLSKEVHFSHFNLFPFSFINSPTF